MPSASSSEAPWKAQDVTWTYRVGEISLFSARLRLLVHQGHFREFAPEGQDPGVPQDFVTPPTDGALFRSRPIPRPLPRIKLVGGLLRYCPAQYRRYWVDLTISFPEYLAKFSSKSRSTLSRKVKRLERESGIDSCWREYKTQSEIEEFYPLAREVSRKTYQERLLNRGLPSEDAFRREIIRLAGEGRIRGYLLFLRGRPIAYLYCPLWRSTGIVLYRYLGYDPEFEELSPGTVLQYFALQCLFSDRDATLFDFLEGETPQKEFFATHHSLCADTFFLRLTARNLTRVLMREVTEGVSDTSVRVLDFLGVKRWVKRLFRRSAAPRGAD